MSQITTYLQPNGPGSGTVTSVTGGVGINITGVSTINPTVNLDVPVTVAHGGTGAITFTAYAVICAGTTATGPFQNVVGLGTSGQVLTSNGAGALPTWQAASGGSTTTFHTDSGDAVTSANAITMTGAHGINTSGTGSTVTVAINNAITLGDLVSIVGSPSITLTTGDITLSAGNVNLPDTTSSQQGVVTIAGDKFMHKFGVVNTFVGSGAGNFTLTTASAQFNTGMGQSTLQDLTTGNGNSGFGGGVMDHLTTSNKNSAFGAEALNQLEQTGGGPFNSNSAFGYKAGFNLESGSRNSFFGDTAGIGTITGSDNTLVGYLAGALLNSASSNNIIIGALGSSSDSNTLRIGGQGSGIGQVNNCFVAGIVGITTSNSQMVTIDSTTGQLGVATIPSGGEITIDGDTGSATSVSSTINIVGSHGINTSGATDTLTVAIDNVITLGDLSDVTGSDSITLTTGDISIVSGDINLAETDATGQIGVITLGGDRFIHSYTSNPIADNLFMGRLAGNFTLTGLVNMGIGPNALQSLTTGNQNVCIGIGINNVGVLISSGSGNTALGSDALPFLVDGSNNIAIGLNSGNNYLSNESSNIVIGSLGVTSDVNTIRIGSQGSTLGLQDTCFIAGIVGITTSNSQAVTIDSSTGQLGVIDITGIPYTSIIFTDSPYVVLSVDHYISADVTGGAIVIELPNAPAIGRVVFMKDKVGLSATNNITITTVGGVVTIDGSTTFIINTAYESVSVIFNGTSYEVF